MPTVGDVLRRYGGEYLERFGAKMPAEHGKVLRSITSCRTGELGTVHYSCASCSRTHVMGRSCGNRHCPTCQQDKTKAWLEKQTARLLPCPYFLLTFTLPAELRDLARHHHPPVPAARPSSRLSEGAALRLPEPQQPAVRRSRAVAGHPAQRRPVPTPRQASRGDACQAEAALRRVRRTAADRRLHPAPCAGRVRHELMR